jgi:hypothetical protein|nr:hypothetical protein [Kofleriaceae bacterium]
MRALGLALVLAGCAHAGGEPAGPPDLRAVATVAAPPQAALYAGCLADATAHAAYAHEVDHDSSMLLFTCTGDAARAFFDGLADYSARIGSQVVSGGRTIRSTAKVRHDLYGVDYCVRDAATYSCTVTLNVGAFVP